MHDPANAQPATQPVTVAPTQTNTAKAMTADFLASKLNRLLVGIFVTVIIMVIFAFISLTAIMKVTDHQLSDDKMAKYERLGKINNEANTNIVNVAKVEPSNSVQQGCSTGPIIGWEKFFAENLHLDDPNGTCYDIKAPKTPGYFNIRLYREVKEIKGNFYVFSNKLEGEGLEEMCHSTESEDSCISFINRHLKEQVRFIGGRIFIQH